MGEKERDQNDNNNKKILGVSRRCWSTTQNENNNKLTACRFPLRFCFMAALCWHMTRRDLPCVIPSFLFYYHQACKEHGKNSPIIIHSAIKHIRYLRVSVTVQKMPLTCKYDSKERVSENSDWRGIVVMSSQLTVF